MTRRGDDLVVISRWGRSAPFEHGYPSMDGRVGTGLDVRLGPSPTANADCRLVVDLAEPHAKIRRAFLDDVRDMPPRRGGRPFFEVTDEVLRIFPDSRPAVVYRLGRYIDREGVYQADRVD